MQTERVAKIALTVALVSLLTNYLQFLQSRAQTQAQQWEISRLQIEHRKESMLERAAAFHQLVLGHEHGMLTSERSGKDGGQYEVEYAVKIPRENSREFVEWMAAAKPPEITVYAPAYSHESSTRLAQVDGREVQELYEKFAIGVR
jgi:hypothetical protein